MSILTCSGLMFRIVDESDNAIRTVMAELRVNLNQILAIEHEEFIANLNRKVNSVCFIFIFIFRYIIISY